MKKTVLALVPLIALASCKPQESASNSPTRTEESQPETKEPDSAPAEKPEVASSGQKKDEKTELPGPSNLEKTDTTTETEAPAPVSPSLPTAGKTVKRISKVTDHGVVAIPADVVVDIAPSTTDGKVMLTYKGKTLEADANAVTALSSSNDPQPTTAPQDEVVNEAPSPSMRSTDNSPNPVDVANVQLTNEINSWTTELETLERKQSIEISDYMIKIRRLRNELSESEYDDYRSLAKGRILTKGDKSTKTIELEDKLKAAEDFLTQIRLHHSGEREKLEVSIQENYSKINNNAITGTVAP